MLEKYLLGGCIQSSTRKALLDEAFIKVLKKHWRVFTKVLEKHLQGGCIQSCARKALVEGVFTKEVEKHLRGGGDHFIELKTK